MAIFQEFNRQGRTVVIVTHEEEIAHHCRRIVRFRDGVIVRDEPVEHPIDAREALEKLPTVDELYSATP